MQVPLLLFGSRNFAMIAKFIHDFISSIQCGASQILIFQHLHQLITK